MQQCGCILYFALIFELAALVDARFTGALQNAVAQNSLRGSPSDLKRPQSMNMFDSMNIFDSRSSQIQPLDVALNFNQRSLSNEISAHKLMISIVAASALLVFACFISLSVFYCIYVRGSKGEPGHPSSKLKEVDDATDRLTVQSSWSRAYIEAEGEEKEALEMLFRCNIISTEEFASSTITQDHIQECTWIAVHMLRHKPLEEWAGSWQQAQQNFESSVVERFEKSGGASGGQLGLTGRAIAQRLKIKKNQRASPSQDTSMPSSANLDFVSLDAAPDLRPLHS